jgi:hypothetical protein
MPTLINPVRSIQTHVRHPTDREARSGQVIRRAVCFGGLSIFFWIKTGVIS